MTKASGFIPRQTYKNRAEAYRLFFQAQGFGLGQSKFYNDAERLHMVNQDKTLDLASLLAYVKDELKIDAATGQSLVEKDHAKKLADLDLEEKQLKVEKLKREGRKDDRDWIHREKVYEREGALVTAILNEAKYRLGRAVPELITMAKGDAALAPEMKAHLNRTLYQAFQSLYDNPEVDLAFEDEEE